MSAYVISEVEVLDPALVEEYRSLAQATIAKYGGHYLFVGVPSNQSRVIGHRSTS